MIGRHRFRAGLRELLAVAWSLALHPQEFRVEHVEVSGEGQVSIQYPSRPDAYYVLLRGTSATAIREPAVLERGVAGNGVMVDPESAGGRQARFYRVMQVMARVPLDLDGDGLDDFYELGRGAFLDPLDPGDALEDRDGDGLTNLDEYRYGSDPEVAAAVLTTVRSSPADGETGVALTRETVVYFSNALAATTSLGLDRLHAEFGGRRVLSRVELSTDRRKATLFHLEPLPVRARVRVTFDASGVLDRFGQAVDADGDGVAGGVAEWEFETLGLATVPGTIVCGRVFASELAPASAGQPGQSVNVPLPGVTITVDGQEETMRAVTDALGNFRLDPAPAGAFFVHIDGRTAGAYNPANAYYPFVGKRWESVPGIEVNLGDIYLPRVAAGTLSVVSATVDTPVTLPPAVVAEHPELAGVRLVVPANALFDDSGIRGGMVGLAPVPPDRLPEPLPPGLNLPVVITVQTDGASNFDRPVPVCFPNLPDPATGRPLPPGSKSALWSFNHDTGRFEVVGPMTVSADGQQVCTDPGVGIPAPGWHGSAPGSSGGGGGDGGPPPCRSPKCGCNPVLACCEPPPGSPEGDSEDSDDRTNPVWFFSGEKQEQATDLRIAGVGLDFAWVRTYNSRHGPNTAQGNGWDFSYNLRLEPAGRGLRFANGGSRADVYQPRIDRPGAYELSGFFHELERNPDATHTLQLADRKRLFFHPFDGTPLAGRVTRLEDRNGNALRFQYDSLGRLVRVTDTLDRDIVIAYDAQGFIASVTDFAGRQVRYEYYGVGEPGGSFGDLKSVTTPAVTGTPNGNDFPEGKTTRYTYSTGFADDRLNHNLLTITDGRRNDPADPTHGQGPYLVNVYSNSADPADLAFDRVVRQVRGGGVLDLTYVDLGTPATVDDPVLKVIVNDAVGNVSEHEYDSANRRVRVREFTGRAQPAQPTTETVNRPAGRLRLEDPEYFETRFRYNGDSLVTRIERPNGNVTEYVYESALDPNAPARTRANLRAVRRLPGTHAPAGDQAVLEERFEYDTSFGCTPCGFNFVTRHLDARGQATLSQYDDRGNLLARTNPIPAIVERFEYNARGQLTRRTWPDNGSGHRRVDTYTYYESGPQRGYLRQEIVDAATLALTTTYEYDAVGNVVRRTDPEGRDTQYVVNALNQVVREVSPEVTPGSGVRYRRDFHYDANNNRVRLDVENRDATGALAANAHFTTTFEYEVLDRLVRQTAEVSPDRAVVTEHAYDANRNRVLTRYGEATAGRQTNNVVLWQYDERNRLYREVRGPGSPEQSTTQFDYDGNGNLVRVSQGLEGTPRILNREFDGYDRWVAERDALGNRQTRRYDPNGNPVGERFEGELLDGPGDAQNLRLAETTSTFDALNRLVRVETDFFDPTTGLALGDGKAVTETGYSDSAGVTRVTDDQGHAWVTEYDSAHRPWRFTDPAGNQTTHEFDRQGNLVRITRLDRTEPGGAPETLVTTRAFDGLDRLVETTDGAGNVERQGYDSRGNLEVFTDGLGNRTLHAYDGLSRRLETTRVLTDTGDGSGRPMANLVTREVWDDSSRRTARLDAAGNATTYVYDGLGRLRAEQFADGTATDFRYDPHHNVVSATDANGTTVSSEYDLLNRVTERRVTPGPGVAPGTTFERFAYDGRSRLVRAEDDDSLVVRAYDSLDHLVAETLQGQSTRWTYDATGNLTECRYPGGRAIAFAYDALDRPETVTEDGRLIARFVYRGAFRVVARTLGNGTETALGYNGVAGVPNAEGDFGFERIDRHRHSRTADGSPIEDLSYAWDRAGNKIRRHDERPGALRGTTILEYDSAYRLRTSERQSPTTGPENRRYDLDAAGNRREVVGGPAQGVYAMDPTLPEPADRPVHQYTATGFDTRQYDRSGNLVRLNPGQPTERAVAYDHRHRMVTYQEAGAAAPHRYAYDALGRRIQKTLDGPGGSLTRYFYSGSQVIEEQDAAGTTLATYVQAPRTGEPLELRRGGQYYYYHTDDLGSVLAVTDATAAVVERYEYDDFGLPAFFDADMAPRAGSVISNPLLFAGLRYDAESGWYRTATRYLDPRAGRFTTRDPLGVWGDAANWGQALTYVGNNPATFVDPQGTSRLDPALDPCVEAKRDPAIRDTMGSNEGGGVICKDGKMIPCAWSDIGDLFTRESARRCTLVHEREHFDEHAPCEPCPKLYRPKPTDDHPRGECDSYTAEIRCLLEEKERECSQRKTRLGQWMCRRHFDSLISRELKPMWIQWCAQAYGHKNALDRYDDLVP